jgi:hypothetical protein
MNRPILVYALLLATAAALTAQEASQTSPYQGTSTPPSDDTIETSSPPQAKPPAGQPAAPQQAQPAPQNQAQPQYQPQPSPVDSTANYQDPDGGIVQGQRNAPAGLAERTYAADPDGDIVHPHPLRPGELQEGTTIRVRLLQRLSTRTAEKGEPFRSRVAWDVLQGSQVLIPAGAEIDGRVVEVSSGHAGGRGTMRLRPETVILADGSRYHLSAEVTGTRGSKTHVGGEGTILPDSRLKRDGIEYGGAVGAGATTGAIVGGPVGALTGTLIGAGVVTVHLLVSHPQAVLEPGTTMLFTTTERLNLVRDRSSLN